MATYTVRKGDTLSKIAKKYNTTVEKLQKLNLSLISDVNKISVGWVLNVSTDTQSPTRCKTCEALNKALKDIGKLDSVKTLERLIGG